MTVSECVFPLVFARATRPNDTQASRRGRRSGEIGDELRHLQPRKGE